MDEPQTVPVERDELTVTRVREAVLEMLTEAPDGEPLDTRTRALVEVAVRACGTTLDIEGTGRFVGRALTVGVTPEQLQEMFILISGIGLHCLLACSRLLRDAIVASGDARYDEALTGEQAALQQELIGDGLREARTAEVAPGFLDNILRLSGPATARAVYRFRAAPWLGTELSPLQKELIGISVDTMPSHRFLPTLRLHVRNAVALGGGRLAIAEVLDIAGAAPDHRGVW